MTDNAKAVTTTTAITTTPSLDPLLTLPSHTLREGDHFLLYFSDGRQVFGHCSTTKKGVRPLVKINRRMYPTHNLIGLPYGTVLEQGKNMLVPLAHGEGLLPSNPMDGDPNATPTNNNNSDNSNNGNTTTGSCHDNAATDATTTTVTDATQDNNKNLLPRDNRNIVDDNNSQRLREKDLSELRDSGLAGSKIVEKIIENSATFSQKTDYSRAKYVVKKQQKYQPRCRIIRCNGPTICEALYSKDPKRLMNFREDTLGQVMSYANISGGSQVLVWEGTMGIITGTLAQRMGGYGQILSFYTGQQHAFSETLAKFNLSFAEYFTIHWIHTGDIPALRSPDDENEKDEQDIEKADREVVQWPCPLQEHTRQYLQGFTSQAELDAFLSKRCARFARKLTRHTALEARDCLLSRQSDCLIVAVRYDPTASLKALLPHLAPSCPFVVFSEFIEPLSACFLELQRDNLAINLRLSDTWAREYQVLPGRTHPNMHMSQTGGFLLTGIKLDPVEGVNELDAALLQEIKQTIGGRRGKRPRPGEAGKRPDKKKSK